MDLGANLPPNFKLPPVPPHAPPPPPVAPTGDLTLGIKNGLIEYNGKLYKVKLNDGSGPSTELKGEQLKAVLDILRGAEFHKAPHDLGKTTISDGAIRVNNREIPISPELQRKITNIFQNIFPHMRPPEPAKNTLEFEAVDPPPPNPEQQPDKGLEVVMKPVLHQIDGKPSYAIFARKAKYTIDEQLEKAKGGVLVVNDAETLGEIKSKQVETPIIQVKYPVYDKSKTTAEKTNEYFTKQMIEIIRDALTDAYILDVKLITFPPFPRPEGLTDKEADVLNTIVGQAYAAALTMFYDGDKDFQSLKVQYLEQSVK